MKRGDGVEAQATLIGEHESNTTHWIPTLTTRLVRTAIAKAAATSGTTLIRSKSGARARVSAR